MDKLIHKLKEKRSLDPEEIQNLGNSLIDQKTHEDTKYQLLQLLHQKGETVDEITLLAQFFLKKAIPLNLNEIYSDRPSLDVCGTGGDHLNLFNVSTTSLFVVAAANVTIIKHGNRNMTSQSGGADVLQALGIAIDSSTEMTKECLRETGIGFLLAPLYHPAFKSVAHVRKKLAQAGIKTLFNLLGPLLNPANPDSQLLGVYDQKWVEPFTHILKKSRQKKWHGCLWKNQCH